jgi:hypothetical protein
VLHDGLQARRIEDLDPAGKTAADEFIPSAFSSCGFCPKPVLANDPFWSNLIDGMAVRVGCAPVVLLSVVQALLQQARVGQIEARGQTVRARAARADRSVAAVLERVVATGLARARGHLRFCFIIAMRRVPRIKTKLRKVPMIKLTAGFGWRLYSRSVRAMSRWLSPRGLTSCTSDRRSPP